MSMKRKIVTAAATLTLTTGLAAGLGAAGTLTANAATSACGNNCVNWFSAAFGTAAHPAFVLNVPDHVAKAGQPVTLAAASGANKGEDFWPDNVAPVGSLVAAGLMNHGLDALYSSLSVYEFQYAPGNKPTGLCAGVGTAPGLATPVTLQPCGVTARTTWILDPQKTSAGSYDALISGATSKNFSHPYALTTLLPRLRLFTDPLLTGVPAGVLDHQLWAYVPGALPTP